MSLACKWFDIFVEGSTISSKWRKWPETKGFAVVARFVHADNFVDVNDYIFGTIWPKRP